MLTCICPGMSSANHTLNSLRYAERLKEKGQGQGGGGTRGYSKQQIEVITEDLKQFMEKHGKSLEDNERQENPNDLNNLFY